MNRAFTIAVSYLALTVSIFLGPCAAADSPSAYQIDPARDGSIAFTNEFSGHVKLRWMRDLGGPVSYPVFGKGFVFVTVGSTEGGGTQLYAISQKTGETVWHKAVSATYTAYDDGRVFTVNFDGLVQAFSADSSGRLLWSRKMPGQYAFENPLVATNGLVYVDGAGGGVTLYAVDEKSGAVKWTQGGPAGNSGPAVGDGGVYVVYPCNYYKYDQVTGSPIWHDSTGCDGGGGDNPTYFNGRVYIHDWTSGAMILNSKNGKVVGSLAGTLPPAFWTSPSGKTMGFVLDGGTLESFDPNTQNIGWSFAGDGQLSGAPIVISGVVVIATTSGKIYLLNAATGAKISSASVGAATGNSGSGPQLGANYNTLAVSTGHLLVAYADKKPGTSP